MILVRPEDKDIKEWASQLIQQLQQQFSEQTQRTAVLEAQVLVLERAKQFISPDDYEGNDSAKITLALATAIDQKCPLNLGCRTYQITDPIVIPTINYDSTRTFGLNILSFGAILEKQDAGSSNDFVIATQGWVENVTDNFTHPITITGSALVINGQGIAKKGFVYMGGQEKVLFPRRGFRIISCLEEGMLKPNTTKNGSAFTGFSGGFVYHGIAAGGNGTIGISIKQGAADWELDGDTSNNGTMNIEAAAVQARILVFSFYHPADILGSGALTPSAGVCARFTRCDGTWFDESQFGSDGANTPVVEFVADAGSPLVRNVSFQGGNCLFTFPTPSGYYKTAQVMHSNFERQGDDRCRIKVNTDDAALAVYSSHNNFDNGGDTAYAWEGGVSSNSKIIAHRDFHGGGFGLANGLQDPATSPNYDADYPVP